MSVVVGEDAAVLQALPAHFDHRSHACLLVPEDEDGYEEVRLYAGRLLAQQKDKHDLAHYTVTTSMEPYKGGSNSDGDSDDELESWECGVSPGNCLASFDFEGTTLWILTRQEGPAVKPRGCRPRKFIEVLLFAPGRDSIGVLKEFVRRARIEINRRQKDKKFSLFRWVPKSSFWRWIGDHPGRDPSTLILPAGMVAEILSDVNDFFAPATRSWYMRCGIPYKRSLLLYGPPGSGKSSVIRMIASQFKRDVCYLQPAGLSDASLADAVEDILRRSVLVLEDVDALFAAGRQSGDSKQKLTFSGVLNCLDGLISPQNGQLIIMTSNHPEKLDPAMIRCGRVDRRFELPGASAEQARHMFHSFYPDTAGTPEGQQAAQEFARQCLAAAKHSSQPLSMASLHNYFILGRKLKYKEFLGRLPGFIKEEQSVCDFGVGRSDTTSKNGNMGESAVPNGENGAQ